MTDYSLFKQSAVMEVELILKVHPLLNASAAIKLISTIEEDDSSVSILPTWEVGILAICGTISFTRSTVDFFNTARHQCLLLTIFPHPLKIHQNLSFRCQILYSVLYFFPKICFEAYPCDIYIFYMMIHLRQEYWCEWSFHFCEIVNICTYSTYIIMMAWWVNEQILLNKW